MSIVNGDFQNDGRPDAAVTDLNLIESMAQDVKREIDAATDDEQFIEARWEMHCPGDLNRPYYTVGYGTDSAVLPVAALKSPLGVIFNMRMAAYLCAWNPSTALYLCAELRTARSAGLLPGLEFAIKQIRDAAPRSAHTVATHRLHQEMAALLETQAQAIREHTRVVAEGGL
jgi:hypothetical protein